MIRKPFRREIGICHPFIRSGLFLIALLIFLQIVFPVVSADPASVQQSLKPAPGNQLTAAEYEHAGISLMNQRNWSALLSLTGEGIARYPGDGELYCLRGYALRKTGQYAAAVDNVTRGIALDPRPARYANRGYAYLALGRYQEALDDAETGISMNAGYPSTYGVKTIALLGLGDNTGASKTADAALTLDPKSAHFWQLKGKTAAALGNCSGALEAFNRSLAINSDYDLPWPEFDNATADLNKTELQCTKSSSVPVSPSTTTRAPVPAGIACAALVLAVLSFRNV